MAAEWRNPWAVISPARIRKLKARFENGSHEFPANTNCDPAKAMPPGAKIRRALKPSWTFFHSRSAVLKRPVPAHHGRRSPCP